MPDIKVSALVKKTGFGPRYWQKRIGRGEIPSGKYVQIGQRRIFFVDETIFDEFWDKEKVSIPCQKISSNETKPGGIVLPTRENYTKGHWKQTTSEQLKTALKELSKA